MLGTQYTGKAGHLAVMGEFCSRGYNAAMPEIDKGDNVFVVNDTTGAMWRMQVKTALGRQQATSRAYQFRVIIRRNGNPRHPQCQHRQGMAQIDHLIQSLRKKIGTVARPRKLSGIERSRPSN